MKISAIRNKPATMASESNDSDLLEHIKNSKKARKNKRSTSATTTLSIATMMKTKTTSDEESECDEREKLKLKKRFIKANVLSSPPPITLTLKKTSADSGAFLGESSNAHDNSYLSSSDNELPALVNAAIKCVESDSGSNTEPTSSKMTQQYTSSLLQDYMEKTQLVAQEPSPPSKEKKVKEVVKRKRGRPKKNASLVLETDSGEWFCVSWYFLWLSPRTLTHVRGYNVLGSVFLHR